MILQALNDYYHRNKSVLPEKNFQTQEIKFVIQIDKNGDFKNLLDVREGKNGHVYLLPKAIGRSGSNSWQTANLLWDHYGYLLGFPKDDSENANKMANKQLASFIAKVKNLPQALKEDTGINAVIRFYMQNQQELVIKHPLWENCSKIPGCNMSFQLLGEDCLIPERNAVKKYVSENGNEQDDESETVKANCLVTGKYAPIARIHTATPILGSKSNAKLVGFQKKSGFDSYYKEQAYNAPISSDAEAAYTTSLKYLTKSSENNFFIADTTVVFWAERENEEYNFSNEFQWFFADSPKDDPDRNTRTVKNLYSAIYTGKIPIDDGSKFFVLGLSPNAARISIRFWKTGTVREFADKIKLHFDDFEIIHGPNEKHHLSLNQILRATALEYKTDNIPPKLAGNVVQCILDGKPYPITLMQQCIRRIRAQQKVTRARAAILKAYLNRINRIYHSSEKEVEVSLDIENANIGYRLGRLFAVLEKIQEEANPGPINATIRDRYFGAASSSPVAVFSQLLKLKNHHLGKLDNKGRKVNFEKMISEIFEGISNLPANLPLNDQAYFSIGYYHQRNNFYKEN
ncbi:type I-C CRISPR-associated protein Cas8c/Csd1 [Candidatus Peregrinibacteria bacterium]|nr:type I-C CRISPR-associated protein Cas8c/Csd1 [Candidatus Peregrinibacteria bacterium]